jgi:hypothetical protein
MAPKKRCQLNPMKRPDNTEIDRLLRRHLRPGGGAARAIESAGAHMDADEMNAYAEGALPEGARARYFAHLADCDSCRKLVTELTLAATASAEGRESAVAAATAAPSKSWRERLAAIFSPPVLRYAVPALALFAVVAVALVAMRANRDAAHVARSEQSAPNTGSGVVANANETSVAQTETNSAGVENHAAANTDATTVFKDQTGTQPPAVDATPVPPLVAQNTPVEKDGLPARQADRPEQNVAQSDVAKATSREDQAPTGAGRAQEEEAATTPAPPNTKTEEPVLAAPSATDEASMRDKEGQREAKAAGKDDRDDAPAGGAAANATQPGKGTGELGKVASTSAAPRTRVIARKSGPADSEPARSERGVETRNAGGHSFQRQGDAWVDTAYNSSRPTTNVHRGSEQYRTLVADEPGLRDIVEQLGGKVIVVWKGRAYRFY